MAADRDYSDVDEKSDLGEIAKRRGLASEVPYTVPERSEEEIAARRERILQLAGSLKGLIPDDFVEENYRQRLIPSFRDAPGGEPAPQSSDAQE